MKAATTHKPAHHIDTDTLERVSYDQSKRAEVLLDTVLDEPTEEVSLEEELAQIAIEEAKRGRPIIDVDSGRTMARVLFVTQDKSYLEPDGPALTKLKPQAALFDEVHILVVTSLPEKETSMRVASNIFVYQTGAAYWWWRPQKALAWAKEQLVFGDSFRADIIVSLDPDIAGVVGSKIARYFKRPHQVHVLEDYFSQRVANSLENPSRTRRLLRRSVRQADSVRVATETIKQHISNRLQPPAIPELLPRFHNFKATMAAKPVFHLKEKYPQYSFIILTFAPFELDSPLQDVFTAAHELLKNPKIGLVVIGEGKQKALFQEKAKLLGIEKNVIFDEHCLDLVSCLKSADMLLLTTTHTDSEETVLQAAAAGLPMVLYETELRSDLFEDGESATLCEPGDTFALEKELKNFINNSALRVQYAHAAEYVITTRLHEDETSYYQAYRDSIETGIFDKK